VPFSVTIASAPQRGLKLEWLAVEGVSGYRIERDVDASDGVDNFQFVAFVLAPAVSRTITDLSLVEALNHKYRISAMPAAGPALATATGPVTGDLTGSINAMIGGTSDDSLDNVPRTMATAQRHGSRHVLAVGQPGANQGTGVVKIYERPVLGGPWTEAQLPLSKQASPETRDHFGASVALSPNGMYLAVGIPGDDRPTQGSGVDPELNAGMAPVDESGAVEVYQHSGAQWERIAWFKAINAGRGDAFGTAVAISDEGHLFVGAPNEDSPAGAGTYFPTASDADELRDDRDTALDRGALYAYRKDASGYHFAGFIKPPTHGGGTSLYFGATIAVDGSAQTLAVGAPHASYNGLNAGGVVLFDILWTELQPPHPPATAAVVATRERFGPGSDRAYTASENAGPSSAAYRGLGGSLSMSEDGTWLAAGYADKGGVVPQTGVVLPPNAGQVNLYRRQGLVWAPHSSTTAPVPVAGDRFGTSVSLVHGVSGLQLLVGAPEDGTGHKGLTRSADIEPEGFVANRGSGAAYSFVGHADPGQPPVLKARLKSPDPIVDQFLGQATAITRDGRELLLTGEYKSDSSRPFGQAIFFGY